MRKNSSGFVQILVTVLFLIGFVSLVLYYLQIQGKLNPSLSPASPTSTANQAQNNDQASWKTYTSSNASFAINYPPSWNLTEVKAVGKYAPTDYVYGIKIDNSDNEVHINWGGGFGGGSCPQKYLSITTQAGPTTLCDSVFSGTTESLASSNDRGPVIENKNKTSSFVFGATISNSNKEIKALVIKILSTFKFLDQNNLQGAPCGGWDSSGEIVCGCTGNIIKSACSPGVVCDGGTYYCQGQCGACCYKGIAENAKYPKCQ